MTWLTSKQWRKVLVIAFAFFALVSIILFSVGMGSIKINRSNNIWVITQLQLDQQKMQSTLQLYRVHHAEFHELYLCYEMMWGRFAILLEAKNISALEQYPDAVDAIRDYFTDFKTLEPLFTQNELTPHNVQQVQQVLDSHSANFNRLVNHIFLTYRHHQLFGNSHTLLAIHLLGIALFAVIVTALVIFYLFRRQLRIERLRATQDAVTGLPNRAQLLDTLNKLSDDHPRTGLMLFAIDSLPTINSRIGFDIGDQVLRLTTQSLQEVRPAESQLFRTSNDEFALLFPIKKEIAVQRIAAKLQEQLQIHSQDVSVHTPVLFFCGAAISNPQRQKDGLMQCAEMALIEARQQQRIGMVTFIHPQQVNKTERLRTLSEALHQDLAHKALTLHFQPILDTCTQQIRMLEACPRWYHLRFGQISTHELWQLAEHRALTQQISQWLLNSSLHHLRHWNNAWPQQHLAICIPISNYLLAPELPFLMANLLQKYQIAPDRVTLQIDGDNPTDAMITVLHKLHKMGLKLALGDFGRHPSSLIALQRVLLDYIKIDCTLYATLMRDRKQQILLRGILQTARRLNIRIIFDHVNTEQQRHSLSSVVAASWVQGEYFCRALPAEGVNLFMLNHTYLDEMQ